MSPVYGGIIIAEAIVPQSDVGRFAQRLLAAAAEFLHPDIPDARSQQRCLQTLTVEMRKTSRHGKRSNVDQSLDLVRLKNLDQFFQTSRGMPDGVKDGQLV